MLCFQRRSMQKEAYAKAFLSDASQPEIRPFPPEYALTLPNFVLLSVSTLKYTILQKPMPKNATSLHRLRCVAQKLNFFA